MIPISLSLRNFLSYRDNAPTLYLDGVHVACLCGPNGHGKSALLDAITWALWGEARGKRQEELIHFGQQEMRVELEFLAQGQRYRVIRRYARAGRSRQGATDLQLQVASDGGYHPLGESAAFVGLSRTGETQAAIKRLLNMDYPTFINSAFLLQGRADAFTTATPRERKDVLARVLGLGFYDRLEERAKEYARHTGEEAKELEVTLDSIRQELAHREEYEGELSEVRQALVPVEAGEEARAKEIQDLRRHVEHLQRRAEELDALQKQLQDYRRELAELEAQIGSRRARLQQYQAQAQRIPTVQDELVQVGTALEKLEAEAQDLAPLRERLQAASSEAHHLRSVNASLKEGGQDLRAKVNMLAQQAESPRCPLCNTELGPEGCRHLADSYHTQIREKAREYRENEAAIGRLEAEGKKLEGDIARGEEAARRRRKEGEARLVALERELQAATMARDLIAAEAESLATHENLVRGRKREVERAEEQRRALEEEMQRLPAMQRQLREAQAAHQDIAEQRDRLRGRRSVLEDRLKRCAELAQASTKKESQLKALLEESGIYQDLARALGKRGVQALLIEAAIPRLEEEANRLLGRMTDHRMTLRLETQRERRTGPEGEPIETLEVFIADELGTRSYEMFSGGEAFRINLALRVALSKLLAWRSGASLPTLFIDEGFGTQDASGQERIIDVINSIQDDFQRILVVTHMEEIKEAFPVRIEVTKTEAGSTFVMT